VVSIAITLAAQSGGMRLMYRTKDRDGAPIEINELVHLCLPSYRRPAGSAWSLS
jgi:hypothetical protein